LDRGTITPGEAIQNLPAKHNKAHFARFLQDVVYQFKAIKEGVDILNAVREKGYKTYVLSNFHEGLYDKVHKQHDFFKDFDGVTVSAHVKTVKPEPAIYQKLLSDHNLVAEECLFIDDKEENVNGCPFDAVICADHAVLKQELQKRGIID
jgi:putative hydrolase of the HAD superfamily